MREHVLTPILILILLVSCKQTETKKAEIVEQNPTTELKSETEIEVKEDLSEEQFIENDSLAFAFESKLERYALKSSLFKIELKPYQNRYDNSVIDTMKTLIFDKTTLKFYKAKNWESIIGGVIKNSEIKFVDSLKIGIHKRTLESILKTKIESDKVTLGNLEQTSLFFFQFENGILESIKFEGYFE